MYFIFLYRWWKKSNFETKVPYARGRLVEAYLWSLAMSYKPEHSLARMFVGKLIAVVCLLDDTYDAYGTIQELELFTEAIQRLMRFTNYSLYDLQWEQDLKIT